MSTSPTVGVLALQGAFAVHEQRLRECGATARQVRTPDDLSRVDALVMPGGESTTMSKLLESQGLLVHPAADVVGDVGAGLGDQGALARAGAGGRAAGVAERGGGDEGRFGLLAHGQFLRTRGAGARRRQRVIGG